MKRKLCFIFTLLCVICLSSCRNDDNINEVIKQNHEQPDVEVLTIGQWNAQNAISSRSNSMDANEQVLRFKNEEVYNRIAQELKNKSDIERLDYFEKLGFKGIFTKLIEADNELEEILDNDDPLVLKKLISEFKNKHKDKFSFNTVDTFDITPNFTFDDERLSLVGNTSGMVLVGNKLIKPESSNISLRNGPINPGFVAFKGATVRIKHKKYKSTMTLGRIQNGNSMAIKFETTKKVLFWRKNVRASHTANLGFNGDSLVPVFCEAGYMFTILNLDTQYFFPTFDAVITEFKSSRCPGSGNAAFKNIVLI